MDAFSSTLAPALMWKAVPVLFLAVLEVDLSVVHTCTLMYFIPCFWEIDNTLWIIRWVGQSDALSDAKKLFKRSTSPRILKHEPIPGTRRLRTRRNRRGVTDGPSDGRPSYRAPKKAGYLYDERCLTSIFLSIPTITASISTLGSCRWDFSKCE